MDRRHVTRSLVLSIGEIGLVLSDLCCLHISFESHVGEKGNRASRVKQDGGRRRGGARRWIKFSPNSRPCQVILVDVIQPDAMR